jgi:serine/threonine protein kinase
MASAMCSSRHGNQFGPYRVVEKIGSGGMGSVYKCEHLDTKQTVAVKILRPELATDATMMKRFEQEFQAASRLRHPNVVQVLEFGRDGPTCYFVMEYVDGMSLWDRVERTGRLAEAEAVAVIVQVAQAVQKAHEVGLIHRDIKPDNILLTAGGQAKLTDLGCVKDLDNDQNLTRTRQGLGTANFMAVEQFRDAKNVDARCDVYSLGATLYMAVTGKVPFESRQLSFILKKKLENDLPPARRLVPRLSAQTERAIHRAVRASAAERPKSCLEFIEELTGASLPITKEAGASSRAARKSPATSRPFNKERRTNFRYSSALCGLCQPVEGEEEYRWSVQVKNISASGISMLVHRRFEIGTPLRIELGATQKSPSRILVGRVVRLKPYPGQRWETGCTLIKKLSDEEASALQ